jgi:hypothetical protein
VLAAGFAGGTLAFLIHKRPSRRRG